MNVNIPARVQVGGRLNEWTADPANPGMKPGRNASAKFLTFPDQPDLTDVVEAKSLSMFDADLGSARQAADASISSVMSLSAGENVWITGRIKVYKGAMSLVLLDVQRIPADDTKTK